MNLWLLSNTMSMVWDIITSGVIFITLALSYILPAVFNIKSFKCVYYVPAIFFGLFFTPTYFNLFTIYSMANLHDVSWGNREGGGVTENTALSKLKSFRTWWFCFYIIVNGLYAYLIIVFSSGAYSSSRET